MEVQLTAVQVVFCTVSSEVYLKGPNPAQADGSDDPFASLDFPLSHRRRCHAFPAAVRPSLWSLRTQYTRYVMTLHRSHVYTTFHKNEIHLDDIIQDADWADPEMMLTETNSNLDKWQVDTALATWRAMRNSELYLLPSCRFWQAGILMTR